MKITDLRVRTIQDKYLYPFTNALGTHLNTTWKLRILEVFTNEGVTGVLVSHMIGDIGCEIISKYIKPIIQGENPMQYEKLWQKMFGGEGGKWRYAITRGEAIRAISAIDTAIWDIIGKTLSVPIYMLLGGYRTEVPCYASGGHYISLTSQKDELKHLEKEMGQYMEMGFSAVKMRVGRDVATDCERAKLVRSVIGPDIKLMFDFNTSCSYFGGVPHAIKFMKALEEYDPFWFEDPLIMDDIAGMLKVNTEIDTAIASGECEQTLWGFRDLIVNRAVDVLLPDATQMCGGITQWRKIAAMAEAFHMPIAAHIGDNTHVHCIASIPNGLIVEVFLPLDRKRREYEVNPICSPDRNGLLTVPIRPGLGIELNESFINSQVG